MKKSNNVVEKFKKEKKKRKPEVKKVTREILKNFSKPEIYTPMKIEELPGDLLVYLSPLYAIPNTITTVKELRDEINSYPENKLVLERLLKELHIIYAKSYYELCKGDVTVIDLYNRMKCI